MRSLLGRIDKAIYFAYTRGQEARSAAVVAAATGPSARKGRRLSPD